MKLVNKFCKTCEKEFLKTGANHKYCSPSCRWKSRNEYIKNWCIKNPIKPMLAGAKNRAKRNGIVFDISEQDVIIPEVCPIFKTRLERGSCSGFHDNSPSLDRIDNKKGYVKGNIRVISNRANLLKSDATLEELELLVKDARRFRY